MMMMRPILLLALLQLAHARGGGFRGGFRPSGAFRGGGGGEVDRGAGGGVDRGGWMGQRTVVDNTNNVNVNKNNVAAARPWGGAGYWHPYGGGGGWGPAYASGLAAGAVADAAYANSYAYAPAAAVVYTPPADESDDGTDSADPSNPNGGILSASAPAPPPFLAPTYVGPAQPPPPASAPVFYAAGPSIAAPAACTPAQPQGVSASPSAAGVTLAWSAPDPSTGCLPGSYSIAVLPNVQAGAAEATPLATFAAPGGAASFSVPGSILAPGTTYSFQVQALSPAGVGSPAAFASAPWSW